jgi:hypothetical protein
VDSFFYGLDSRVQALLQRLEATPLPVPPEFRELTGTLAGESVRMQTEMYACKGFARLAWASMATVNDPQTPAVRVRQVTRTMVGFPHGGGPILGLDVVAMKGKLGLFALDLAATDVATWNTWPSAVLSEAATRLRDFTARAKPEFAQETFSDKAIIGSAAEGAEDSCLAAASCVFSAVESAAVALGDENAANRLSAWIHSERNNRKEFGALKRIFGESVARAYFEDFLFSDAWQERLL